MLTWLIPLAQSHNIIWFAGLRTKLNVPGELENMVNGRTTVSGASTILSSTLQQSFSTQE